MRVLLDTGPWVALIDRSEARHRECVEWLRGFDGVLLSTEAVLTEVLYLLNFSWKSQMAAIDFVLKGAVILVPASLESLEHSKSYIEKYRDVPMDYADATLVSLAEELSLVHVATFDARDFGIYRLSANRRFLILP